MSVECPSIKANNYSALQAIMPLSPCIDGTPIVTNAVSASTIVVIGTEGFYIMSNTPIHFAVGVTPVATLNSPPIPANMPMVFRCNPGYRVAVIKQAGAADGSTWIHGLA